jgi:nucleoid-associated protein YgaU
LAAFGVGVCLIAAGCTAVKKSDNDDAGDNPAAVEAKAAEAGTDSVPDEADLDQDAQGSDEEDALAKSSTPRRRKARVAAVSKIVLKKSPTDFAGANLNAFYFIRSPGETWETMAQTLYGDPAQGKKLQSWNPDVKLGPGKVVYYQSSRRPKDKEKLLVFCEDFGVPLTTYKVVKGDTLSKISERLYRSLENWVEIAALNPQLRDPNVLEPGMELKVQPNPIDTGSILKTLAQAVSNAVVPSANAAELPKTVVAAPEKKSPEKNVEEKKSEEKKSDEVKRKPAAEASEEHHEMPARTAFMTGLAAGLGILGGLLFVQARKKKAAAAAATPAAGAK